MAVVAVMAAKLGLQFRKGGALFATLADLAFGHLSNTCRETKKKEGSTVNIS